MSQSCSNCFNGCAEIVSDKCVKYTGIDIPVLGILNGDSLSYVEQTLIGFLTSTLDGSGIKITLPTGTYCTLVNTYLPTCGDITVVDILTAVVKSACDLQTQITTINGTLATLNADYTIGCLTGVTASTDTHAMLQAVITKLCSVDSSLTALINSLPSTYTTPAQVLAIVTAYINSQVPAGTQQYQKMVPYTVVEYYGTVANFDSTGAGIEELGWDKVYLCNGLNNTPDKRGRVAVGAIQLVPGNTPSSIVNPSSNPAFNPDYALNTTYGSNSTVLTTSQIPSHNHNATSTSVVTDPGHKHLAGYSPKGWGGSGTIGVTNETPTNSTTFSQTGITVATSTVISSVGGGLAHTNVQPVLACYYIMYIPS